MTPKKTQTGHSLQLRIGAGRRPSFQLATLDPERAQRCTDAMEEMARLLVDTGRLREAHKALTRLGAVADSEEELSIEVEALRLLCAEPLPEPLPVGGGITVQQFGEKWTSGKLAKEFPDEVFEIDSLSEYQQKLEVHYPTIGRVPLALFAKKDFRAAMAALPEKLGPRSRQAYGQVIVRLLNLAVRTDVLDRNPLPEGILPKVSTDTEFQCLYPHEDQRLAACKEVDFADRFTFAFDVRTGLRVSTLFPLRWRDVNFVTGLLTGRAKDTRSGAKKKKGRRGKRVEFVLQPDLLRALSWWRAERESEPLDAFIFPQRSLPDWAKRLRAALLVAGVDRPELHHPSDTGEPIGFHDLRASFVTFALANGRSEAWIMERTGHTTSQMIVRYQRDHIKALEVHDWLPLDVALGLTAPVSVTDERAADERADRGAQGDAPRQPTAIPSVPERETEHDDCDADGHSPAPALPVAPLLRQGAELASRVEVEERSEGARRLVAQSDELPELLREGDFAGLDSEVETDLQVDAAEGAAGLTHDASDSNATPVLPASVGGQFVYENRFWGVATGVATGFSAPFGRWDGTSMFSAFSSVRPPGVEPGTSGLEIRREEALRAPERREPSTNGSSCARSDAKATRVAEPLPVSAITERDLELIAALLLRSGEWETLAHVAHDRAVLEESRATRSNVTSLLVERRRRS